MTKARIVVEHEVIIEGLYLCVITKDWTRRFKPQVIADLDYQFIFDINLDIETHILRAELYSQDRVLLKRTELNRIEKNFSLTYNGSIDESKVL